MINIILILSFTPLWPRWNRVAIMHYIQANEGWKQVWARQNFLMVSSCSMMAYDINLPLQSILTSWWTCKKKWKKITLAKSKQEFIIDIKMRASEAANRHLLVYSNLLDLASSYLRWKIARWYWHVNDQSIKLPSNLFTWFIWLNTLILRATITRDRSKSPVTSQNY